MSVAGITLRGMKAGRRFRTELTEPQARFAQQTADTCRAVYNTGLEQRREYRRRGAWINYEQQARELVEAKKEHTWLTRRRIVCSRHYGTWMKRPAGAARSTSGGVLRVGGCRRFGSRKVPRWRCRS
jgi:putative transposase